MPWESSRDFIRDCLAKAMKGKPGENGPGTLREVRGKNDSGTWFTIIGTWRLYARFLAAVAAESAQTAHILDFSMVPGDPGDGSGEMEFFFVGCRLEDFEKRGS
jgi:hypothetical protein